MRKWRITSYRGDSLIEILIATAVVGILTTYALSSLREVNHLKFLKQEARKVQHAVEDLILKAQGQLIDHELIISTNYYITKEKNNSQILSTYYFPKGVIAAISSSQTVSIYKNGVVSPSTIVLNSSGLSCRIMISLRGRVRVLC